MVKTILPLILNISSKINTLKITLYIEGLESYVFSKISIGVVIKESHIKLFQNVRPYSFSMECIEKIKYDSKIAGLQDGNLKVICIKVNVCYNKNNKESPAAF